MAKYKEIVIFYLSEEARDLIKRISAYYGRAKVECLRGEVATQRIMPYWQEGNLLIFVMALGVVVRVCAPFVSTKERDPGVLVIDELGRNIIPFLGGHYAEVNCTARELAQVLGANPVITTSSDLRGLPGLDLWIKKKRFVLKDRALLPSLMARINRGETLTVFAEKDLNISIPHFLKPVDNPNEADIVITYKRIEAPNGLLLIPRKIWLGVGFHENLKEEDFENILLAFVESQQLEWSSIKGIATLKKKTNYTPLINFCLKHKLKLIGFDQYELSKIETFSSSEIVKKLFNVGSVCEGSALLASRGGRLLIPKTVFRDMTVAVAIEGEEPGKVYVVGIGPGHHKLLTLRAIEVFQEVDVIVGYKSYLRRIEPFLIGKEVYAYSMREELDRVKKAIESALQGKDTALVSGGDPGIYGMAGLLIEVLAYNNLYLDIEIVPGVSALNACNALLGAPLANDFVVISLSDRLTPWEIIERRLEEIARTDLPLVLFNPRSSGRKWQFKRALEIIRKHRSSSTPVGIVTSAYQEGERVTVVTLGDLPEEMVNMQSLVIIGSEATSKWGPYIFSRRGYDKKYSENYEISLTSN